MTRPKNMKRPQDIPLINTSISQQAEEEVRSLHGGAGSGIRNLSPADGDASVPLL